MDGQDFDDGYTNFLTADSPAEARVHVHHLAVIRLAKAALVAALETGGLLYEERDRRGDGFDDWVNSQLGLSLSEAECFIRFYGESGVRTGQLSPLVDVKLPRVLELLGQLNASFPGREAPPKLGTRASFSGPQVPKGPSALPGTHRIGPLLPAEAMTTLPEPSP
jgi:hypothetical protein